MDDLFDISALECGFEKKKSPSDIMKPAKATGSLLKALREESAATKPERNERKAWIDQDDVPKVLALLVNDLHKMIAKQLVEGHVSVDLKIIEDILNKSLEYSKHVSKPKNKKKKTSIKKTPFLEGLEEISKST